MKTYFGSFLHALPGLIVTLAAIAAPAQLPTPPDLFDRPDPDLAAASLADPTSPAPRSRPVSFRQAVFDALPAVGPGRVQLPLFPDREYTAVIRREANTDPQFISWRGSLEGWVHGHVSAVYRDGILSMHISDGEGGEFDVRTVPGGTHRVVEAGPGLQGVCAAGSAAGAMDAGGGEPGFAPASSGSAVVAPSHPFTYVDVLILYTPNARNAAGGTSEIHAKVWQCINDSNWRFARSDAGVALRAVGIDEFPYDDSAQNLERHLDNLSTTNNGPESIVSAVLARRDEVGADLVCLLTHGLANSGDVLGIARVGLWPSVVEWRQDTAVFTHELGHNLGCRHEKGAPKTPDEGHNHGFRHRETWDLGLVTESETRVSIMYSGFAPSQRTDYFSNPDIHFVFTGNSCGGLCADVTVAMGDAGYADNARYLRENRATTARFRQPNFYLNSAAGPGGNATERQPDNNVALVYSTYFPATEVDPSTPAVIRLAPGNYASAVRITQKSRLEKWGGGAKARIGP